MSLNRMIGRTTLALGLALGGLGAGALATPALAQQSAPAPAPEMTPAPQQAPADFAEDELRAFIEAALAVSDLERAYVAEIQSAESDAEREEIVAQANEAMREAIEQQDGIDVDRYIEIGQAAQADPELNATLMAMLEEMQTE